MRSAFELLAASLVDADGEPAFLESLRQLYELSREAPLTGALRSKASLDALLEAMRAAASPDRAEATDPKPVTVVDGIAALDLIEHQLRPLFGPAPEADLCHATANGLAALTGMVAQSTARARPSS